jgi:hypothetical protein
MILQVIIDRTSTVEPPLGHGFVDGAVLCPTKSRAGTMRRHAVAETKLSGGAPPRWSKRTQAPRARRG